MVFYVFQKKSYPFGFFQKFLVFDLLKFKSSLEPDFLSASNCTTLYFDGVRGAVTSERVKVWAAVQKALGQHEEAVHRCRSVADKDNVETSTHDSKFKNFKKQDVLFLVDALACLRGGHNAVSHYVRDCVKETIEQVTRASEETGVLESEIVEEKGKASAEADLLKKFTNSDPLSLLLQKVPFDAAALAATSIAPQDGDAADNQQNLQQQLQQKVTNDHPLLPIRSVELEDAQALWELLCGGSGFGRNAAVVEGSDLIERAVGYMERRLAIRQARQTRDATKNEKKTFTENLKEDEDTDTRAAREYTEERHRDAEAFIAACCESDFDSALRTYLKMVVCTDSCISPAMCSVLDVKI